MAIGAPLNKEMVIFTPFMLPLAQTEKCFICTDLSDRGSKKSIIGTIMDWTIGEVISDLALLPKMRITRRDG